MPARQIIESQDLKGWFGSSTVVDSAGQPLEVWHGSTAEFQQFDFGKARDGAHFFTANPNHASWFGPARSFYLKIENPLVIDQGDLEDRWDETVNDGGESGVLPRDMVAYFVREARAAGHDGLIVRGMADLDLEADVYLPFSAEQIRPADSSPPAVRQDSPGARHENLIQEGSIVYGWAKGGHVIKAPFTDGEDNHHITNRHLLPDGNDEGWKRWRFNSNLDTVFWWEAPTVEEREAVKHALAAAGFYAHRNVFVELGSTASGNWSKAKKMPRFNLDRMANSSDPLSARAADDLLDVTHYQDAPSEYVSRWLARVGD